MPTFKFKAQKADGSGGEIEETREAENELALAADLRREGYVLTDFHEGALKKKLAFLNAGINFIRLSEKMLSFR